MAEFTEPERESPRIEDYLEAIFQLIHEKSYANTVDIAEKLDVRPSSVSNMVKNLASMGYLVHEPYRGMRLTEKGSNLAKSVIERHNVIMEFLTMLGVSKEVAYWDTEGIEHHLHPVTFQNIEKLVRYLRKNPRILAAVGVSADKRPAPRS